MSTGEVAADETGIPSSRRGWRPRLSPVVRHELADRFRGNRGGLVVTGYVAVMGLVLVLLYLLVSSLSAQDVGFDQAGVGRFLFENFIALEFGFMLFVGAGYAAAQVAAERERQTLPLLQVTAMSPMQIVAGKWWAVVAWQALLLVMGMPLAGAASFFGGVGLLEVLLGTVHMVLVAAAFSAVAIWISSVVRRTSVAIIVTYAALFVLMLGPLVLAIAEAIAREDVPTTSMYLHVGTGLAAATLDAHGFPTASILSPFVEAMAWPGDGFEAFDNPLDGAGEGWRVRVLALQWTTAVLVTWLALWRASHRVRPGREPRARRSARRDRAIAGDAPVPGTAINMGPPGPTTGPPGPPPPPPPGGQP